MKFIIKITCLLFYLPVFGQLNDSIIILPNYGINDIELLKSEPKDVKDFNGFVYSKSEYKTIRCGNNGGKKSKFTYYFNNNSGIKFTFKQNEIIKLIPIWSKFSLVSIEINKPLKSSDNLKVGYSLKEDVIAIYGEMPKNWQNENYYYYSEKGISFDFDKNNILKKIAIFKI